MVHKMTEFKSIFQQFRKDNNLRDDPVQERAVEVLSQCYKRLMTRPKKRWFSKQSDPIKGVYLWGGVGRGKTMIMDLFFDHVPLVNKKRVHFNVFMMDVHQHIKKLREKGQGDNPLSHIAKDIASGTQLLCFDEFQVYDIADAMVLSGLFRALFDHGVCVVATSNVDPQDLYKNGLQRDRFLPFIPLVQQNMNVLFLDSPTDYRQQAIRENGVYFVQDEAKMLHLFEALTITDISLKQSLDISGRLLAIEKVSSDMAWVTFSELCEKPRGVPDYKALAEAYGTIFINDIPRMGYDRRNELKRFILLIDTLYDMEVRTVFNAEIEPKELYHGDDHAFEFQRTISRILEMQGEDYLSKTN